ncbi:NUDIX hydrolase [Nocardioides sp. MH1]|uniref:NUDIX hydrolase n=1 Tax=Nocardioides sp. MH1 TaxID=3242490 RepID=UPI00352008BC
MSVPDAGPIHRVAVRLLPVSPDGRVLLLQGQDPARPGDLHWVSVGGAVDPGEDHEQAAVRELHEETGIVGDVADLVGPIGTGVHPFSWAGTDYVSHSTFYAIPVAADVEVHFGGLEPAEVGNILQAAWWTPDDLRADGTAASDDMPDMMETAIDAVLGGAR